MELLPHTQLSKQTAAGKQDYEEIQSILEQQKAVGVIHLNNYKLNTAMIIKNRTKDRTISV